MNFHDSLQKPPEFPEKTVVEEIIFGQNVSFKFDSSLF
jgi:hypothetical protein